MQLAVSARRTVLRKWQGDSSPACPMRALSKCPNLYMFLSREGEVMRQIRAFASSLPALGRP